MFILIPVSLILFWASIYTGRKIGLLDHPDARKTHSGAVPLVGGIAIFASLLAGLAILHVEPLSSGMIVIASAVFVLGIYDDLQHLSATWRLLLQYASGIALATYGGIAIHNVGNLLAIGDIPLLLLTVPLTALSVAGLSNAYNMIDGIDGLAASLITLPLLELYLLAASAGHPMAPYLVLLLIPMGIFLAFNLGPDRGLLPRIFLGDAGSVTLGFLVTAALVYFSQGTGAIIAPVTALWLVTVPLMDMLATMLRRVKNGRPLMAADRSHLHHALMDLGLGARQTLAAMVAYATVCAVAGLALEAIPEYLSLLLYFLLFIGHCLFVANISRLSMA